VVPGLATLLVSLACSAGPSPSLALTQEPKPTEEPPRETRRPVDIPEGSTGLFDGASGQTRFSQSCLEAAQATPTPTAPAPTSTPAATPTPEPRRETSMFGPSTGLRSGPAPFAPIAMEEDRALRDQLMSVLGGEAADYAFVVKDLSTGRGAAHNPDKTFYAASLFKLFVMYEAFNQQASGSLDWQDELLISPYYESQGLGLRATALCQELTVSEAMQAMMGISDNAAAVLLQDLVRASNVNKSIQSLGLLDSGLYSEDLPATASDIALLLEAIASGEAVSEAASADMVELMASEQIDNGLRSGVPSRVEVAHKTGNWSDATHDAGIVFAESGPYLFVAMSATDHKTRLIEDLSRVTYERFSRR
jgi:beta-lactamase class A